MYQPAAASLRAKVLELQGSHRTDCYTISKELVALLNDHGYGYLAFTPVLRSVCLKLFLSQGSVAYTTPTHPSYSADAVSTIIYELSEFWKRGASLVFAVPTIAVDDAGSAQLMRDLKAYASDTFAVTEDDSTSCPLSSPAVSPSRRQNAVQAAEL